MGAIKWKVGHEDSAVVEEQDYEESIFYEQYLHSFKLIEGFVRRHLEDSLQIVAFCGERGSGKTSCMKSVVKIIQHLQDEFSHKHTIDFFKKAKLENFTKKFSDKSILFEIAEMIDPSFFDKDTNILELLIAQIYGDLLKFEQDRKNVLDRQLLNSLYDSVATVKECLLIMHRADGGGFTRTAELSVLSSAVRLKKEVRELIHKYLQLKGNTKFLITIDDIDLNREGTYEMCEQIRKYLAMPECIILISFNYTQLLESIQCAFRTYSEHDRNQEKNEHLAARYIDKLVASRERVHMPIAYNLCNRELYIYDDGKRISIPGGEKAVKDVVVSLIFQRTRFLFYNSKGGISPIIPNNLRELLQLLGMLWELPLLPNKDSKERRDILEFNKGEFKSYFYRYWIKNIELQHRKMVKEIIDNAPSNTLNQTLSKWLSKEFQDELNRNYDFEEENYNESNKSTYATLVDNITSKTTFSYNVSVGDVFYLINSLLNDTLSPAKERLLFFIRSYYSILLYEAYDVVTEGEGERYPDVTEESGIYTVDRRFDHTNELQRLINGGFFTYRPGELLPNVGSKDGESVDMCILKAEDGVRDIFVKIHHIMKGYDEDKNKLKVYEEVEKGDLSGMPKNPSESEEEYQFRVKEEILENRPKLIDKIRIAEKWFRLGEFLVMTVSRAIPQKELTKFNDGRENYRENVRPFSLWSFNMRTGYMVMDVLYPFYALVNPQFAYGRFDLLAGYEEDTNKMYTFALNHDFSLLRNMMNQATGCDIRDEEIQTPEVLNDILWQLQSDAIIRNGEVLMAVFENAVGRRFEKYRTGSRVEKWIILYHGIGASGLTTHKTAPDEEAYKIDFRFLQPLIDFLKEDLQSEPAETDSIDYCQSWREMKNTFEKMFYSEKSQGVKDDSDGLSKLKSPSVENGGKDKKESEKINKSTKINPFLKGELMQNLERILGSVPLTASQIHDKLRGGYINLSKLTDKDMRQYVVKKRNDSSYSIESLAEYILKKEDRLYLWTILMGQNFEK